MVPLGFGEINLDKPGALMASTGETSPQDRERWSFFFAVKPEGAWHDVFSECLWGRAASLAAIGICFRPHFKVQPGFWVFALLCLRRNYPKNLKLKELNKLPRALKSFFRIRINARTIQPSSCAKPDFQKRIYSVRWSSVCSQIGQVPSFHFCP